MMKLWEIVSSSGLILGIFASIISIYTFLRVKRVEKLASMAKNWIINVKLSEPENGAEVSGYIVKISGNVDFRTTAAQVESNSRVNLALQEKQVELVPFVKPLSHVKWWWAQSKPVVSQDGRFEGGIYIGEKEGAGIGVDFQIVVLALPNKAVKEGCKFVNLPFYYTASDILTVKRVR
ncbi:MAG: hypothetical protein KAQ99_07835 [Candidatus Aureabacteria bacterium]|nr:hypothetical protein [Candidatus Auribacterota bacterium]MCK5161467.1 hypothetical protein [Candidatus Auribacterota bacterium]